jgi:IBR domain, a half RING-finger domain
METVASLNPPPPKPTIDPMYFYIPGAALGLIIFLICAYCAVKSFPTYWFKFYYTGVGRVKYALLAPIHPRYSPQLDRIRNKFLDTGECCVCNTKPIRVLKLSCGHGLCIEDMNGYLESALGDISQFPVKCPMHYDGCLGTITSGTAKRVLTRIQYEKFIEFADRAAYGDGMRCIFCMNYVNFPVDGSVAMVSCPYCVKRFCIRCKKPWHVDQRCPLEKFDDTLEQWKEASGAQKCPACLKLIEKDDPDTCNHMVHKITDSIPCINERTDFCCKLL